MPAPRLSIVVPARNTGAAILDCLRSIDRAGVEEVEVVVVDDGSEDGTADIVRRAYSPETTRVRVVVQDQLGISAARNRGFQLVSAPWVAFVDADDQLPAGSLAAFLSFAEESTADIVVGDFVMRDGERDIPTANINAPRGYLDAAAGPVLQRLCLSRIGFSERKNVGLLGAPWAKLYRTRYIWERFESGEPFPVDVPRSQDIVFNVEAFGLARCVGYYPSPVYIYQLSPTSHSRKPSNEFLRDMGILSNRLAALIERYGWNYLQSAVARQYVTLFDEAVLRLGRDASRASVRSLSGTEPFRSALRTVRLRDFTLPSLVKFLALRFRSYSVYMALLRIARMQAGR